MSEDVPTPSNDPSPVDPSPADPVDPNLSDPAPSDPPSDPPADQWGDQWRQDYSGDDDKMQKRLERYSSPKAALDALVSAQNKISSGELQTAWQPDGSDEEKATWRTNNGIPEDSKGYEIQLADGMVLGENDQPVVDSFLESAHSSNLTPSQVNDALGWYLENQENQRAELESSDAAGKQTSEDSLRAEWGVDYRKNLQAVSNLLDNAPEGIKAQIMGARLEDGTPLGNNVDTLNWLSGLSRQVNPMATVVPGAGTSSVQAVESELASIKTLMGDRSSKYWKGPESAGLQARYDELANALNSSR